MFKLKRNGVSENLFKLITSFLICKIQRVTINGQATDWETICAGVPQGSILGPFSCMY